MGRKTIAGLTHRGGFWHIDKLVKGYGRLCESCGTDDREEAERYLIHRLETIRQELIYGIRPKRIWREAATKYLQEHQHMPSIDDAAMHLKQLDPFIGAVELGKLHDGTLRPFIQVRKQAGQTAQAKHGVSNRTVNIALQLVTRILNLAARKWRDENGLTWLDQVPVLTLLDESVNRRSPYPLSWEEQRYLFQELPEHLAQMALFKVNTGCREKEVCYLRWDWEVRVPELGASVFLIPARFGGRTVNSGVKKKTERLVVLNAVARSVMDEQRGQHDLYVFPYKGDHIQRMNGHAWRKANARAVARFEQDTRQKAPAGFSRVRVHDLKHTFGRRLRAAGVTFEDRQALLGHKSGSVTTDYSAAELGQLIDAANRVVQTGPRATPTLTLLRRKAA